MPVHCPGQNMQYWTPDDIFFLQCPFCDEEIEFWKDEPMRICPNCGNEVRNPKINLGCAEWCRYAKECLGELADEKILLAPKIERLKAIILKNFEDKLSPPFLLKIEELADKFIAEFSVDPGKIKPAALLAVAAVIEKKDSIQPIKQSFREPAFQTECLRKSGLAEMRIKEIYTILDSFLNETQNHSAELKILREIADFAMTLWEKKG